MADESDRSYRLGWNGGPELSVGVLAADLLHLGRDLGRLERAGVRVVHFDLMDGRFCPDLSIGPWFVAATKTSMLKDVHLLVADPENWVEPCVSAGAGIVTVHVEAGTHVHRALEIVTEAAQSQGTPVPLRGLAICPGTPRQALEPFLDVVDIVYVLGINPGWRQALLPSTAERAVAVREMLSKKERRVRLAIDGGVTLDNFADIASLRPDLVVSGSAVFSDGNMKGNLEALVRQGAGTVLGGTHGASSAGP